MSASYNWDMIDQINNPKRRSGEGATKPRRAKPKPPSQDKVREGVHSIPGYKFLFLEYEPQQRTLICFNSVRSKTILHINFPYVQLWQVDGGLLLCTMTDEPFDAEKSKIYLPDLHAIAQNRGLVCTGTHGRLKSITRQFWLSPFVFDQNNSGSFAKALKGPVDIVKVPTMFTSVLHELKMRATAEYSTHG